MRADEAGRAGDEISHRRNCRHSRRACCHGRGRPPDPEVPSCLVRIAVLALVAGFAAIGLSLADSSAAATAPITWKVESAPFRISFYQGSRLLVREHTGPDGAGTRLSYRINEGGTNRSLTNLLS